MMSPASIDALYSMCELNEVAWAGALHALGLGAAPDPAEAVPRLVRLFDEERNPQLLDLQDAARTHGAPFLVAALMTRRGLIPLSTSASISRHMASVWRFSGVPESVPTPM